MGRDTKITTKNTHSILYRILNALFGTIVFVLIYKIWLDVDNNYFYIFLAIILSGLLVSWTLRIICGYFETNMTIQFSLKNLIGGLVYATLVWGGIISFFFDEFPNLLDLIVVLMLTKIFVFLLSDFLSDKITFGG